MLLWTATSQTVSHYVYWSRNPSYNVMWDYKKTKKKWFLKIEIIWNWFTTLADEKTNKLPGRRLGEIRKQGKMVMTKKRVAVYWI